MIKQQLKIMSVLPLLYVFYSVFTVSQKSGLFKLCDIILNLQYFALIVFVELLLLYLFSIRGFLVRFFNDNKDLSIVFLIVLVIKVVKFELIGIDIDVVYLLHIILSSILEFSILLPFLYMLGVYNFMRFPYKIVLVTILVLNISSFFYFYSTLETINPIIFDNLNLISIQAVLYNLGVVDYLSFIFLFGLIVYLFKIKNNVNSSIDSIKIYAKVLISISIVYVASFYLQEKALSKTCSLYGFEKQNKNIVVDSAMKNTMQDLIQSYASYVNDGNNKHSETNTFIPYTKEEKDILVDLGLLESIKNDKKSAILNYDKVIFIAFESLNSDFIHYYNEKIPKEVSFYLDELLQNYPHLNNFYTFNMPTQEGLNSFIRSKMSFKIYDKNETTLFSFFDNQNYNTYYLRAISKYYGEDQENAKKYFKAKNIITKEDLVAKYGSDVSSNWGVHNDTVYDEALNIIKNNKKLFLFVKTIDFHHPGVYYGDIDYPDIVKNDDVYKSLYWLNKSLESFIAKLNDENLLDDKTILFISADHNAHNGKELRKYMINQNDENFKKLPLIIITKDSLHRYNKIKNTYSSQADFLPTFITENDSYIGRNLNVSKKNFHINFYRNVLYYKSEDNNLKFSFDIDRCDNDKLSLRESAICKLVHNTNNK